MELLVAQNDYAWATRSSPCLGMETHADMWMERWEEVDLQRPVRAVAWQLEAKFVWGTSHPLSLQTVLCLQPAT